MEFLDVAGTRWEDLAVDRGLIHMGHNCNQLDIHPSIHDAMIEAVAEDQYRNYTPPEGFDALRELIAADVNVPDTEVMVTQGATEAIYHAMSALLKPGDQTIVSDPGWPHIANFARELGSEVISIPVYSANTQYKLLPELVRERLTPATRLVTVIDPLNPLGSAYSEDEIKELCAIVEANNAYLLHDATYRDFTLTSHYPAIRYTERAVMNISLSKICGFAGLRVGATICNPKLMARIARKQVSRLGGNWIAQRGAIAAYKTKPEWLSSLLSTSRENSEIICRAIKSVDGFKILVEPSNGNFVAVDVSGAELGSNDLCAALLQEGIVIRSGHYTSDAFGDRFVRITTTVPASQAEAFAIALPKALASLKRKSSRGYRVI